MEKIDMRKLNSDELYMKRKEVVRLKKSNHTGKETAAIAEVSEAQVSRIWKTYQNGGMAALRPQKRGRKKGEQTLLTVEEEQEIRQTIISRTPNQLKMAGFLWTLAKISQYIGDKYQKKVSVRCLSNYMKRWGLTCQRPTKRACGQDIARIEKFEKEEYPAIAARAKAENAEIYWGDETGVSNQENVERGFAEKGKPPVLLVETKRERVNMISAITNQGSVRFMVYDGTMTQGKLLDFMSRLIRDAHRKVFLILDNLRVHHGKIVAAWLARNKDKIEVFFLPPYAPEINPDEYLNHSLKRDVHSGNLPKTKNDMKHKIHSFMRRLQHRKDSVKAFFRHPNVAYLNCNS
jgi:transposase